MATPRARRIHHYTYEAYLEHESGSNVKHEFLDGEIYAMAGGSRQHAALAVAVSAALYQQLRGKPCVVHSSDLKVRVLATGLATYPEVTVICGSVEEDPASRHVVLNPALIVEVTSPSTEEWDRGEKLEHYKQIPSLRACLLVSHRERRLDLWEREPDGSWTQRDANAPGVLELSSVGCQLAVDDVYRGIDLGTC